MRVEVVDCIGEWLQDATYGVNNLLSAVPRKSGDAAPPNVVSFLLDTRSLEAALARLPIDVAGYPALLIGMDGKAEIDVSIRGNAWDSLDFPLAIAYGVREVQAEVGVRDAGYTFRAVMRSLWKLFDPGLTAAATARNNVHTNSSIAIQSLTKMAIDDTVAELGDAVVLGAVRIQLRVRDNLPGG